MSFTQSLYSGEQFKKRSFSNIDIQSIVFEDCEFENCSFLECRFDGCRFVNGTFSECDLSNFVPVNCEFREVDFLKCKIIGADWTKVKSIRMLSFSECFLNYSNFRMLKLEKIRIVRCEAKDVDFIEADLTGGDFKGTDFDQSIFFKTILSKANLAGAKNYSIDIKNNTLKETHFSLPEALSLLHNSDIIID